MNMITYSTNRCVISAICYILVIVGIQINNRLDSKERHESCQFAFERQSEGKDLNHRGMTQKSSEGKSDQLNWRFALQEFAAASRLGKPWQYCNLSSAGIPSTLPEPYIFDLLEIQTISSSEMPFKLLKGKVYLYTVNISYGACRLYHVFLPQGGAL